MTESQEIKVKNFLGRLNSVDSGAAWTEFIDAWSSTIMQTVIQFEHEQSHGNECFLYVCEKLSENRFRRLLKFNTSAKSSFSTWLSAVVFNLCVDWHRSRFGRVRMLPTIAALPVFDQRVYQYCYEERLSTDECFEMLKSDIPGLVRQQISDALGRIHALLTPRQRWQINVRIRGRKRMGASQSGRSVDRIPDPAPTPDSLERLREETAAVQEAMAGLTTEQTTLLYLRFREGLTYERIARMEQLGNAHRARRKVQAALKALRSELHELPAARKRQN
jgi:RNA polymerase sigma factor (sigma-70 family)